MKPRAIYLIAALTIIFLAGCNHEKAPVTSGITGNVIDHSDCKLFQSANLKFTEPDTFSCVQYSYDPANFKLSLQHINAGFNCYPEEIYCEVSVNNDTIVITEFEKEQDGDCLCMFDLDIELQGIEAGAYIVKFIEPYSWDQEKLIFDMDLSSGNEGEYCVVRKNYPWGY